MHNQTFLTGLLVALMATQTPALAGKAQLTETYGKLPLSFEPNQGQTDKQVQFLSRGPGYTLFLTPTETVLSLRGDTRESRIRETKQPPGEKYHNVRMQLIGANSKARVSGVDVLPGKVNYFRGNKPNQWRTNIETYAKVNYENVYPGIDLVYYGNERQLEHDFVVAPGADPKTIRLAFGGAENLAVDSKGDLVLTTGGGELRLHKPLVYQEIGGKRREVEGRYLLNPPKEKAKAQVGFHVAAYDPSQPLIIDPVLAYSTFLGGSKFDVATSIAVDSAKNVYVTGRTTSSDFPDLNGYDTSFNSPAAAPPHDVFVTKLNASGSARVYSTYLGGSGEDVGHDIVVDTAGNAYIAGVTVSINFPIQAPYDSSRGGDRDCFVTKLNPSGSSLIYSTYLGGNAFEYCYGIAVNSAGNAYVTGSTTSSGALGSVPFPTTSGAYDTTFNSTTPAGDAFVTKFNAAGKPLVYSTFLGGKFGDYGNGIVVDSAGNAYATGVTSSDNFPTTTGTHDAQLNNGAGTETDAFVSKLNAGGSQLAYSTFLGGRGSDYGHGIALGAAGNAYITGRTQINVVPNNFPTTPGAIDESPNGQNDGFVTRLKADGSGLVYSTYLGGTSGACTGFSGSRCRIAVDAFGNAYVTGPTASSNFPTTPGAYDTTYNGGGDAFVTKVNATGTKPLLYSTFLGSSGTDLGHGIALDSSRNVYVTGETNNGFSTPHFPTSSGGYDL